MNIWATLYIKNATIEAVLNQLSLLLPNIEKTTQSEFPSDYQDRMILTKDAPNRLIVGQKNDEWVAVHINSYVAIEDWNKQLSAALNTSVINTHGVDDGDSFSRVFYFAAYINGAKKREVHWCWEDDNEENINEGTPYAFEAGGMGRPTENGHKVDTETIKMYCQEHGLDFELKPSSTIDWILLNGAANQEALDMDIVMKMLTQELGKEEKKEDKDDDDPSFWQSIKGFFTRD